MNLLYDWDQPGQLLYTFERWVDNAYERVLYKGVPLASGVFLIEQFISGGDQIDFRLYEALDPLRLEQLGSSPFRPQSLEIDADGWEVGDLFINSVRFDQNEFLPEPEKAGASAAVAFPNHRNLWLWLDTTRSRLNFVVKRLNESRIFSLSGRLTVAFKPQEDKATSELRRFIFDPEMTVGEGGGPGATSC